MDTNQTIDTIGSGMTSLGIEIGSTRIKAVLINDAFETLAAGSFTWESVWKDGLWTYALSSVWKGIAAAYADLAANVQSRYGISLTHIGKIGISAMMHGYLPFDHEGRQLAAFRTWRNNTTGEAADTLTAALDFNIPQRWSIAHLYQAILNKETHVQEIDFLTTLAGYVHWQLSGEKAIGIGDASGMFPIDTATGTYDAARLARFSAIPAVRGYPWRIEDVLPRVLPAGALAGTLTESGARLLDPTGILASGAQMAPPEGDAGTGMVSTNAIRKRTGNISVGTSAFSMHVLEEPLRQVRRDIDIVTTPDGTPVAMVHTSNCTSDINAWMHLFREVAQCLGSELSSDELYRRLLTHTDEAAPDAGSLLYYNCLSSENITKIEHGRPMFIRTPKSHMTLANFMQAQLYAAFAPLKIGMDTLLSDEHIAMDRMIAHGGIFKTPRIAQQILANMLNTPITVMTTASEGGAWGMAVLAAYTDAANMSLADFLDTRVFNNTKCSTCVPEKSGVQGCRDFIDRYKAALPVVRTAAVLPDGR